MANIIGLTASITGRQIMVNADHIIYWESNGSIPHPFNAYANNRHLCATELPNGDTCNHIRDDHAETAVHLTGDILLHVREDIHTINERIDVIQAALEGWVDGE